MDMPHFLLPHSSTDGHQIVSIIFAILSSAIITLIYKFLRGHIFLVLLATFLDVKLLSYGNSLIFWISARLFSITPAPFTFLPTSMRVSFSLRLHVFFDVIILGGVKWKFSMVFICISLIANNVGHFFIFLLAICLYSL